MSVVYLIAQNPRGTRYFGNHRELVYVAPGRELIYGSVCGGLKQYGPRWTPKRSEAKGYSSEASATRAGKLMLNGWFAIVKVYRGKRA